MLTSPKWLYGTIYVYFSLIATNVGLKSSSFILFGISDKDFDNNQLIECTYFYHISRLVYYVN